MKLVGKRAVAKSPPYNQFCDQHHQMREPDEKVLVS